MCHLGIGMWVAWRKSKGVINLKFRTMYFTISIILQRASVGEPLLHPARRVTQLSAIKSCFLKRCHQDRHKTWLSSLVGKNFCFGPVEFGLFFFCRWYSFQETVWASSLSLIRWNTFLANKGMFPSWAAVVPSPLLLWAPFRSSLPPLALLLLVLLVEFRHWERCSSHAGVLGEDVVSACLHTSLDGELTPPSGLIWTQVRPPLASTHCRWLSHRGVPDHRQSTSLLWICCLPPAALFSLLPCQVFSFWGDVFSFSIHSLHHCWPVWTANSLPPKHIPEWGIMRPGECCLCQNWGDVRWDRPVDRQGNELGQWTKFRAPSPQPAAAAALRTPGGPVYLPPSPSRQWRHQLPSLPPPQAFSRATRLTACMPVSHLCYTRPALPVCTPQPLPPTVAT